MAQICPGQGVLDMDVPVLVRMATLPKSTQRRKIPGRPVRTLTRSDPCIETSGWSPETTRAPVLTERTNNQDLVGSTDVGMRHPSPRGCAGVGPPTASTEGQILAVQQHLLWLEEKLHELQKLSGNTNGTGNKNEGRSGQDQVSSNYYCITQGVDSNPGTSKSNSPENGETMMGIMNGKENGIHSNNNGQKRKVSHGMCTPRGIPPMVRIDSLDAPNTVSTVLVGDRYQPYGANIYNNVFRNRADSSSLGTVSSLSRSPSPRVRLRGLDHMDAASTISASTSSNPSPTSQDEHIAVRPVGFGQAISIFGPGGGNLVGEDIWEFDGCDENAHSTTTPTPSGVESLSSAATPNQPAVTPNSPFHSQPGTGMDSLNVDSWSLDISSGVPPSPALSNMTDGGYQVGDGVPMTDIQEHPLKRLNSQSQATGTPSPRSLKPTFSFTSSIISKAKARFTGRAVKKDHDLEDLDMQTVRYKPEGIDKLCRTTKFTKKELQLMYRGFKQECPSGLVNEETFKEIYSQFFPQGDSSHYAHFVFNSFDTDHNGSITFEEFVTGLSVLSRGTLEDKLNWAFKLYDINGDGGITREEMLSIIQSIYDMMGKYSEPTSEDITPGEHVERVFQKMDLNKDGVVSLQEFLESCSNDETITKSMHVFDTIL
ncbi:uncharacterized protein LOC110973958 isoform X2 [Acanthaster planci]|uniref:Uncharacterized protein LOC110973958 isoform X2 n=1 Tax=Acanthaster planci TaxID=133434 RepID=A0A8B7XLS6_ACAPL|nr:uncharacterized protein LOC110973958 isoform X2 [Acanthaster planci]